MLAHEVTTSRIFPALDGSVAAFDLKILVGVTTTQGVLQGNLLVAVTGEDITDLRSAIYVYGKLVSNADIGRQRPGEGD